MLAVASVAFLLATAGCGGVLKEGETRTPYEVDPAPTATPTQTATPIPTETPSPTVTEAPVRAPPTLVENLSEQGSRLEATGSYTVRIEYSVTGNGTTRQRRNFTYRIDREAGRGLQNGTFRRRIGSEPTVVSVYHDDEHFRRRQVAPDGEVRYQTLRDAPATPTNDSGGQFAAVVQYLTTADLERNGTVRFDGGEVVRYTAAGPESASQANWGNLTEYRATVLVDDGLVRLVRVRAVEAFDNGKVLTNTYRLAVTRVGTTTVERPEWVENGPDNDSPGKTTTAPETGTVTTTSVTGAENATPAVWTLTPGTTASGSPRAKVG